MSYAAAKCSLNTPWMWHSQYSGDSFTLPHNRSCPLSITPRLPSRLPVTSADNACNSSQSQLLAHVSRRLHPLGLKPWRQECAGGFSHCYTVVQCLSTPDLVGESHLSRRCFLLFARFSHLLLQGLNVQSAKHVNHNTHPHLCTAQVERLSTGPTWRRAAPRPPRPNPDILNDVMRGPRRNEASSATSIATSRPFCDTIIRLIHHKPHHSV